MSEPFSLDSRLEADSVPVLDLPLCTVRLMNDARFPWLLLVPRRSGLAEIIDLDASDRGRLMEEIALASDVLRAVSGCDKLNVGALGNMVRQLHVHVIARFEGDAAWAGPVWGSGTAEVYDEDVKTALVGKLTARLRP